MLIFGRRLVLVYVLELALCFTALRSSLLFGSIAVRVVDEPGSAASDDATIAAWCLSLAPRSQGIRPNKPTTCDVLLPAPPPTYSAESRRTTKLTLPPLLACFETTLRLSPHRLLFLPPPPHPLRTQANALKIPLLPSSCSRHVVTFEQQCAPISSTLPRLTPSPQCLPPPSTTRLRLKKQQPTTPPPSPTKSSS